eukprot:650961-Prymnesium_polylepis.1
MPIRRLTRHPALPAGSLSALLTPYSGAMRAEAHKSVGSAPNCTGIVSVTTAVIDVTPMLTCVRTGSYGRTVPSAEGTLESNPAAVRSVKRRRATKPSSRTV